VAQNRNYLKSILSIFDDEPGTEKVEEEAKETTKTINKPLTKMSIELDLFNGSS
jgi:hypothetical protein